MLTRRRLVWRVAMGAVASVLRPAAGFAIQQAPEDTRYFHWTTIGPGARVAFGAGGTSLVVASGGQSLLVDTKGYGLGATLRREVEADGNRLVGVVNTHHHANQTGGNIAFTADIPVYAHERAQYRIGDGVETVLEAVAEDPVGVVDGRRDQIRELAHTDAGAATALADFIELTADIDRIGPEQFTPTEVFDRIHTLQVGSLTVELHHIDRAHTDNDVLVWVPALDVMHVGNLVYEGRHPDIDVRSGATTSGWLRCLRTMVEMTQPTTTIVPSDGALALRDALQRQHDYFETLRRVVRRAIDSGMPRGEAMGFIPTTNMGRFPGLARRDLLPVNLAAVYDEMF